jgi:hypothetical protein
MSARSLSGCGGGRPLIAPMPRSRILLSLSVHLAPVRFSSWFISYRIMWFVVDPRTISFVAAVLNSHAYAGLSLDAFCGLRGRKRNWKKKVTTGCYCLRPCWAVSGKIPPSWCALSSLCAMHICLFLLNLKQIEIAFLLPFLHFLTVSGIRIVT